MKGVGDGEISLLAEILANDDRDIDHSQFNELLLLVNKDRLGRPMFRFVFGNACRLGQLEVAVERLKGCHAAVRQFRICVPNTVAYR